MAKVDEGESTVATIIELANVEEVHDYIESVNDMVKQLQEILLQAPPLRFRMRVKGNKDELEV